MLEWHAAARGRGDTWHRDPRALAETPSTFGAFELAAAWDALLASMQLFGWVSAETAEALGLQHDRALYAEIERYIWGLQAQEDNDTSQRP